MQHTCKINQPYSKFFKFLIAGLLAFTLVASLAATPYAIEKVSLKTDVILRTKASVSSVPLATIRAGNELSVLENQEEWTKVKTGELTGYVMNKYLQENSSLPETFQDTTAKDGIALKNGDTGERVSSLQKSLKMLGFFDGEAIGNFGSATEAAVKAYQQARDLTTDGVAGDATLSKLAQEVSRLLTVDISSSTSGILRKGEESDAIKQMQQLLKSQGYFTGDATGFFGAMTEEALIAFQKSKGLTADGVAGSATLNLLFSGNTTAEDSAIIKLGDKGASVSNLQQMLKDAGFYTGFIDGEFGEGTQQALISYQQANGLTMDGVVGTHTLDHLAAGISVPLITGPAEEASPVDVIPSNTSPPVDSANPTAIQPTQTNGSIQLVDWWSGIMDSVYPRKAVAQVIDVRTGVSFNIYRYGGTNHLDFEPATPDDTALFLSIMGGVGSWSARPCILIVNGVRYAAAMNTMGHGGEHLADNNFSGQCCMHFLNSYTHGGSQSNADMQMQVMVAFNSGK